MTNYMNGFVAPFVPTPPEVVRWLRRFIARITKIPKQGIRQRVIYEAGCGDGLVARVLAEATKAYTLCVELDPYKLNDAIQIVRRSGLGHLVDVIQGDVLTFTTRRLDVAYSYLLPEPMKPLYDRLPYGSILVSLDFTVPSVEPQFTETIGVHTVYVYAKNEENRTRARSMLQSIRSLNVEGLHEVLVQ